MGYLPTELQFCILQVLLPPVSQLIHTSSKERVKGRATLLNCSMVCHAWLLPSQQLLYRCVDLIDVPSLALFHLTLECDHHPSEKALWLANAVQALSFPLARPDRFQTDRAWAILLRTRHLKHLEASTPMFDLPPAIVNHLCETTSLVSLVLRTGVIRDHSRVLQAIFTAFPTIQMLELENFVGRPLQPCSLQVKLRLLSLVIRTHIEQPYSAFIASVIYEPGTDDYHGLQFLYVDQPPSEGLGELLRGFSGTLRSLNINGTRREPDAHSLRPLTSSLDAIGFSGFPSEEMWSIVPVTIRSLCITGRAPNDSQMLIRRLASFTSLEQFAWFGAIPNGYTNTLIQYCESRRIYLRVNPDSQVCLFFSRLSLSSHDINSGKLRSHGVIQ
ncbi:hypothetical protein DL96DRAFT_1064895 [Flagelloscypha sp. PMI_526]|nr:hypothetical protein DL96DRAFT_1064895 [Flagelloscypha sp. PMI_526]